MWPDYQWAEEVSLINELSGYLCSFSESVLSLTKTSLNEPKQEQPLSSSITIVATMSCCLVPNCLLLSSARLSKYRPPLSLWANLTILIRRDQTRYLFLTNQCPGLDVSASPMLSLGCHRWFHWAAFSQTMELRFRAWKLGFGFWRQLAARAVE